MMFCETSNCRVIAFVPIPGVLIPNCPACARPGIRVRGPVLDTDHRHRRTALAVVRADDKGEGR